jgi:cyclin-dependent kinase
LQVVTLWYRAPDVLMGSRKYSTQVDVWSVGCIFAEMVNGRPLFPGSSEQDQLVKIFKALGTPSPKTWPQMVDLPEYKATFAQYPPQSFKKIVRKLDPIGLDLLTRMLQYDPNKRLSAEQAMKHRQADSKTKRRAEWEEEWCRRLKCRCRVCLCVLCVQSTSTI